MRDRPESALSPPVLALMARNLIRRGEDHHRIYVRAGKIMLEPVGFAYAHGNGPNPMGWTYNLTLYGPTDSRHEWVSAASLIHCRYSVDASRPWLGVPPWSWSATTGRAITALDKMVADQAGAPHGYLASIPETPSADDEDEEPLTAFRNDVARAKGGTLIMENSPGFDDGTGRPGMNPLQLVRFGTQLPVDVLRTETGT